MNMKCAQLIAIGAAVLLLGCSDESAKLAIDQAKAAPTPAAALESIRTWEAEYCKPTDAYRFRCRIPEEVSKAEEGFYEAAARAGTPKILRSVYVEGYRYTLMAELKEMALEKAASSNDPDLLITAASIYGNANLGPLNEDQQIAFLKRAAAAGDKQAAGYLAIVYGRMGSYENAYAWSLRCNAGCDRRRTNGFEKDGYSNYQDLSSIAGLEKHLSRETIARLQKEAGKP